MSLPCMGLVHRFQSAFVSAPVTAWFQNLPVPLWSTSFFQCMWTSLSVPAGAVFRAPKFLLFWLPVVAKQPLIEAEATMPRSLWWRTRGGRKQTECSTAPTEGWDCPWPGLRNRGDLVRALEGLVFEAGVGALCQSALDFPGLWSLKRKSRYFLASFWYLCWGFQATNLSYTLFNLGTCWTHHVVIPQILSSSDSSHSFLAFRVSSWNFSFCFSVCSLGWWGRHEFPCSWSYR